MCLMRRRSRILELQALDRYEICLEKVRLESKMKQRFRAESVGVIG